MLLSKIIADICQLFANWKSSLPFASALQLVQQCRHLASASATNRMAKSDGATFRIQLLIWNTQLLHAICRLTGKCLIDLKNINVTYAQTYNKNIILCHNNNKVNILCKLQQKLKLQKNL